jgi:hypothetical protein
MQCAASSSCAHTHPPLRAPVSTNALLLRRQEMVEFRASAKSLSLSLLPLPLSQINTLISLSLSGQHPNQTRERNFDIRCSILSMFFSVFEISGRLQDLPETQRSSGEYQSAMRASTRTVFVLVVVVVLVIVVVVVASKDSARPCGGS